MSSRPDLRSPLGAIAGLAAGAFALRAVTSLVADPDFGVPGAGWRSLLQLSLASALVVGLVRSPQATRRALLAVAIVHALMTAWERVDGDRVFGVVAVTGRDRWAHPAIATLAALTAAVGARGRRGPRTVTVTRTVTASPSALFELVTDLSMMGRLSPETTRCEWTSERRGVGATFEGVNTSGARTWSTTCVVTALEHDHRFAFEVRRPARLARWTYEFTATQHGCEVREIWEDLRNPLVRALAARRSGIRDRATHNARTMAATLDNLDALAADRVAG